MAQTMFKAKNNQLLGNRMFSQRERKYNLRGFIYVTKANVRKRRKPFCMSVCGVKLKNELSFAPCDSFLNMDDYASVFCCFW